MSSWFHCDDTTGAIVSYGMSPNDKEASLQAPAEGLSLYVVPDGLVTIVPQLGGFDLTRLRAWARAKIDAEADAVFRSYVTDIAGQDRRYLLKSQEAQAWSDGDELANPERYPFMIAEAAIRSQVFGQAVTVAQVRGEIIAQVQQSVLPEAALEGAKVAYKLLAQSAPTLPAIVAAANVDWQAVIAAAIAGQD
jgi:hypothetical protein